MAVMAIIGAVTAVLALLARIRSLTVITFNPALDSIIAPAGLLMTVRYTLYSTINGAARYRTH